MPGRFSIKLRLVSALLIAGLGGCVPTPTSVTGPGQVDYPPTFKANISSLFAAGGKVVRNTNGEYAASDIQWKDSTGKTRSLFEDYRGKVVVINFWATWCTYCVNEMPSLHQLGKELASDSVAVIGISIDAGPFQDVKNFVDFNKFDYQMVVDPKQKSFINYANLSKHFGDIPQTFVIDRSGYIRSYFVGEQSKSVIRQAINEVK